MAGSATAAVRYVSPFGSQTGGYTNWTTAATNIQAAITIAVAGDTILITNGTYRTAITIAVNKGVTVTSVHGAAGTAVDSMGAALCMSITHADALVSGLTITNGNGVSSGGGVYMNAGVLRNCVVVGCQASSGGGVNLFGGGLVDACLIISNFTGGSGGGVYLDGGGVVTNSVIIGNYAKTHGGGAYIMSDGLISASQLTRNTAENDGGAVNFNNGGYLVKCRISGNTGNKGGALNVFKGTVRNCLLFENHGTEGGAGYLKSGALFECCTIVSNDALGGVGGLLFSGGGTVENTILYYNAGSNFYSSGGGMTYQYTCTTPNPGGTGIVTNEPQFIGLPAYNVHVALTSPCRDTGINRAWMSSATDMDGLPRIWPVTVDMGIYEIVAPPFVDVTTTPFWVSYDVTASAVSGTNNVYVTGGMTVSNTANGAVGAFPAGSSWVAAPVNLAVGTNTIVASGTNAYGVVASDSAVIVRGGPGTGTPFVQLTNTPPLVVSNLVTTVYIAGTNNMNVVGPMYWHNHTISTSGPLIRDPSSNNWSGVVTGLAVGANDVHVHGTNSLDVRATDNITVTRLDAGTNPPFIDITNALDPFVTYDFAYIGLGGTNYNVVGAMGWSNTANSTGGSFPAANAWTLVVSNLIVGLNEVYVFGTNAYGAYASDQIDITRGGIGTGMPFLDVTNTPFTLTYDDLAAAVAGTNNPHVAGSMWATNVTAGGPALTFGAMSAWSTPPVPLHVGPNTIRVYGSNLLAVVVSDEVVVTRGAPGTGVPFVDITNSAVLLTYDDTSFAVAGTNNANVVGGMTVSNATAGGMAQSFITATAWTATAVPLAIGPNTIVVRGTNAFGAPATDSVVITRGPAGTGVPFLDVTNAALVFTYDTTNFAVAGTNNVNVVGTQWVSNAANSAVAAFAAAASWTAAALPLSVGPNAVTVYGTNAFGAVASDSVTITRGDPGTGVPFLDVTSAPAFVTFDITAYAVAGTNNANVVGAQWVSNELNGAVAAFPASEIWTMPAVALDAGANTLRVFGTNAYGAVVSDAVVITRGGPGTGTPFVSITNTPPPVVSNLVTTVYLAGTNNVNVVGGMYWSNHTHGTSGPVGRDAGSNTWSATVTALEVGANHLHVHGTNVYGLNAADDVTVIRLDSGTNPPYIDITNGPDIFITYDFASAAFGGTNYNVVGGMWWSNTTANTTEVFPAANPWSLVVSGLVVGINEVYVVGTNAYGAFASDFIDIERGPAGTGVPFVDVTTTPYWVSFDVTARAVAGTNNANIVGGMSAVNATAGLTSAFSAAGAWTTPAMPLLVGSNTCTVSGTNAYGVPSFDGTVIVRGPAGTGIPFLDVTTTPAWVSYDVTGYIVAGTNNLNVVGSQWLYNDANGLQYSFPAASSWTAPAIALEVGINTVYVYGTNAFGVQVYDTVAITRGAPGTGIPFLDVTTTPYWVSFDVTSSPVAGTNNANIVGRMWVSNAVNGSVASFAAVSPWTTPPVALAVGENTIRVYGTNAFGVLVNDSVAVTRGQAGTGTPFVDITNDNIATTFDTPSFMVAGSNNVNVVGGMWVSNIVNGSMGSFLAAPFWIAPPVTLEVGGNLIVVYGTNAFGVVVTDSVLITHLGPCSILPAVWVTSQPLFVTYDTTTFAVAGTNNQHVVGTMRAANTANGAAQTFPAALSWTAPTLPLAVGSNAFYVFGTNVLGVSSAGSVAIVRGDPGTGVPFLDVTTTPATVYLAVSSYAVAGTNNPNVIGGMWVSNAANGSVAAFAASAAWDTPAVPLVVGTNSLRVYGSNAYGSLVSDVVDVIRLPYDLAVTITAPNGGLDFTAYGGTQTTNISGSVNETPLQLRWTNLFTGAGDALPNAPAFSFPATLAVGTNTVTVFASGICGSASASITISVSAGNPPSGTSVLCLWPSLIGAQQTGVVEFVTTQTTAYSILVSTPSNSYVLATGICSNGWNRMPFPASALPFQIGQGSNTVSLKVGIEVPIPAGYVLVVSNLATAAKQTTTDFDGDLITVAYKSKTGTLTVEGRTLFIRNGSLKDTLVIKVKPPKTPSNRSCRISGLFSDSGFASVVIVGSVDRFETAGPVKSIKTKTGGLGHGCNSALFHICFDSTAGKAKLGVSGGDIAANVLVGTRNPDGSVNTRGGLSQLSVSGGNIGTEHVRHWLEANSIGSVMAKGKKGAGGLFLDYALYLTGEVKPGKDQSIGSMTAFLVHDTSGSNANIKIVCGHSPSVDPLTVTSWVGQIVSNSLGKLTVKGGVTEGTFVLDKKPKKTTVSGLTNITWIVNGVQQ